MGRTLMPCELLVLLIWHFFSYLCLRFNIGLSGSMTFSDYCTLLINILSVSGIKWWSEHDGVSSQSSCPERKAITIGSYIPESGPVLFLEGHFGHCLLLFGFLGFFLRVFKSRAKYGLFLQYPNSFVCDSKYEVILSWHRKTSIKL